MTEASKIAFFDSGIGGLTVLKEALKILPEEDYIYFADVDNVPYGTKPKETVKKLVFDAVNFLANQNIKILVLACNTATSVAVADLRREFSFPIVGMEPAVKPALEKKTDKKILVTATSLTLKEEKLKNLITTYDRKHRVKTLPLDKLVKFAENLNFESDEVKDYIKNELSKIKIEEFDTIVLGCTHFIYFKKIFHKILGNSIALIDGNEGTTRNLKRILTEKNLLNHNGGGKIIFFASKRNEQTLSNLWLKILESKIP